MSAATLDRAGGEVIARGEDYRQTFQHFRPGFDLAAERLHREEADFAEHFDEGDLYPDARPCLEKLKQLGFLIGAAGNQAGQAERRLRALGLPLDFIGTSAGWEVEKPAAGSWPGSLPSVTARLVRSPM